jgi:biopolymer transport protein ExbD
LLVEANGESLHEKVVAALDAGSDTGFENVLLATVEGE